MTTSLKYGILVLTVALAIRVDAQETNTNNQAIVTIIGDPAQTTTTTGDFINTNPYTENNTPPPVQAQLIQTNQNIEPTLENGFHMRFEVNSDYVNHGGSLSSSSYSSSGYSASGGGGYIKTKKHSIAIAERSFNFKKRIKSWLPEHKKKYHPHLCGRF